jgi:ribosomal-protein-alanine N-acetyltransferase
MAAHSIEAPPEAIILDWSSISYPPAPYLSTPRLALRELHINDASTLQQSINRPEILLKCSNRVPNPYTLEDAHTFINRFHAPHVTPLVTYPKILAITLLSDPNNTLIGVISLEPESDVFCRSVELGYWLSVPHWGHGYITEVASALVDWGFRLPAGLLGTGPILRITGNVYSGNAASGRVLEKVGFVKEGTLRDSVWKEGVLMDLWCFGVTRKDWERRLDGKEMNMDVDG